MATPYLVYRAEEVASTQDLARERLGDLPVLVVAGAQTEGRGRGGAEWLTAPRALAASFAFWVGGEDTRPFSLMAGIAAVRSLSSQAGLKWPNDVVVGDTKVGGILVERSGDVVVAGFGLNLWWPDPPPGVGAIRANDPGPGLKDQIGGLWAAELMRMMDGDSWPLEEYLSVCVTLGRRITWEPGGEGTAVAIGPDGGLVVEQDGERTTLTSGEVRHIRH